MAVWLAIFRKIGFMQIYIWIINKSNANNANGGALILGGTNSAYYTGSISYVNLVQNPQYWQFNMDGYIYLCYLCNSLVSISNITTVTCDSRLKIKFKKNHLTFFFKYLDY